MRIVLKVEVTYDETTVSNRDELERALERELERAIADGLLNPGGEIVDEYWAGVDHSR